MCLQTARVGNPAAERALAKPAQLPSRFVITRDRPLATSTVRVAGPSEKAVKKRGRHGSEKLGPVSTSKHCASSAGRSRDRADDLRI